jgi:transcriptional regulator with XRE-family HTH domain
MTILYILKNNTKQIQQATVINYITSNIDLMKVHENIRFMRIYKDWTQETLANKLGISTLSYAKIERGETDINLSRLQQISEVMEIDLAQLFGLNEKNVFYITSNNTTTTTTSNDNNTQHQHCSNEQEKINSLTKENELLKQNINDLRNIIKILKDKE